MAAKNWIYQKKGFLFDLDGTLYLGDQVIPGAVAFLKKLREQNKQVLFFTNNSSRSDFQYLQKLKRMNFDAKREEILMSTHSLIATLQTKKVNRIFLLGTAGMKRMLAKHDIQTCEKKPQMIIVGFDRSLTYKKLRAAAQWIASGVPYGVTHPDLFCPHPDGPEPDCGAIAKLLEFSTNQKPQFTVGKPHPLMVQLALKRMGLKRSEVVLFGDRLSTDIQMAHDARIDSVFVLSGDNSRADLRKTTLKPQLCVSSVKSLL